MILSVLVAVGLVWNVVNDFRINDQKDSFLFMYDSKLNTTRLLEIDYSTLSPFSVSDDGLYITFSFRKCGIYGCGGAPWVVIDKLYSVAEAKFKKLNSKTPYVVLDWLSQGNYKYKDLIINETI